MRFPPPSCAHLLCIRSIHAPLLSSLWYHFHSTPGLFESYTSLTDGASGVLDKKRANGAEETCYSGKLSGQREAAPEHILGAGGMFQASRETCHASRKRGLGSRLVDTDIPQFDRNPLGGANKNWFEARSTDRAEDSEGGRFRGCKRNADNKYRSWKGKPKANFNGRSNSGCKS